MTDNLLKSERNRVERKLKKACKRAIANILYEGTSDVNPVIRPFEIELLEDRQFREKLQQATVGKILKSLYPDDPKDDVDISPLRLQPIKHLLSPKKTLADYRNASVIDINDEIVYLTLAVYVANRIERRRWQCSKKVVYSYRWKVDEETGALFSKDYSFESFRKRKRELREQKKYSVCVTCDVASYYDRLNLHRLESTLLSIDGINKRVVTLLNKMLLFWAGRNSYGLPVGSNASRILAEALMIGIDDYLRRQVNQLDVAYCRFVDDFAIYAKDAKTANHFLEHLVNALRREGLFLNSGKTKVKDISFHEDPLNQSTKKDDSRPNCPMRAVKESEVISEGEVGPDLGSRGLKPAAHVFASGYSGLIPLRYRSPSDSAAQSLREKSIDEMINKATSAVLINEGDDAKYQSILQAMDAQGCFQLIYAAIRLLELCPQFFPYTIDFLTKHESLIDERCKKAIAEYFETWLRDRETPESIRVSIARLFSLSSYTKPGVLSETYLDLSHNAGEYIGRALLECMDQKLTRLEVLELRDKVTSGDVAEIRALARLVFRTLPSGEANAWLRNMSIRYEDMFLDQIKHVYQAKG